MTPSQISIPNRVQTFAGLQPAAACRDGFTILEVLISAGIMVIGLACVASLLPAAAQRMSQAVSEDRAGTLAANAYADITARRSLGLLSAATGGNLNGLLSTELAVFGCLDEINRDGSGGNDLVSLTIDPANYFPAGNSAWEIHDALDYGELNGSPINALSGTERTYRPGLCWLATVTSAGGASSGSSAELSIAIFKKQPDEYRSYSYLSGTGTINGVTDDERRQFLKGCSYVLDVTPGQTPAWRMVTASWESGGNTSIVFDVPPPGNATLLGFERLLRVEKHRIVLD